MAIQACFYLHENGSHLFEGKLHLTNYTSQMACEAFDCILLNAAEMGGMYQYELLSIFLAEHVPNRQGSTFRVGI